MIRFFRKLLLPLFLVSSFASAEPANLTWGSQTLASQSAWPSSTTYYGFWGNMVLTEGRYPLVVYLDKSSTPGLRSVFWENGEKHDELMFPVDYGTREVRLVANGNHVAVAWMVFDASQPNVTIKYSQRAASGWSVPETVSSNVGYGWDLALTPEGVPVVAASMPGPRNDGTDVKLLTRQGGQWISELVTHQWESISNAAVLISSGGVPSVAWRSYSINPAPVGTVRYATRSAGQWTPTQVEGASLLGAFFAGPAGEPCMIASGSNQSSSFFVSLAPGQEGIHTPISGELGDVSSAVALPDGTIHVTLRDQLISRRNGQWSATTGPASHVVLADADGALHLLGTDQSVLRYQTLLPQSWTAPQFLTTYEQGSVELDDLTLGGAGRPKVYAWLDGARQFFDRGLGWGSVPLNIPDPGWSYALHSQTGLHAFSGAGKYATPGEDEEMEVTDLPVTHPFLSSSSLYSLIVDPAGRPHVGFYTQESGAPILIRYGVKNGEEWTIETVTTAEVSDQHCALALDASGGVWMFNSKGLYRRGPGGWTLEYAAPRATFPGLGIASDGTVHAVFRLGEWFYALTGRSGSYTVEMLEQMKTSSAPGFAMIKDRPMVVYSRRLDYSAKREVLVQAEKVGNHWRQRFITPVADGMEFGRRIKLGVDIYGGLVLAANRQELQTNYYRATIFVCTSRIPDPEASTLQILQSVTAEGVRRFSMNLDAAPYWQPIELQASANLAAWNPLFGFGQDFSSVPQAERLSVRGDAFRTRLSHDAPAGAPAYFLRFATEAQ